MTASATIARPVVAQTTVGTVNVGTSISATFAAAPRAGDVVVAGIGQYDGSESSTAAPAGWSRIAASSTGTTGATVSTFYHVAGSAEPKSYLFHVTSPHGSVGIAVKAFDVSGVSSTAPVNGSWINSGSGGMSDSPPAVRSASAGLLPLAFLVQSRGTSYPQGYRSSPAGWSDPYQALFGSKYALAFAAHAGPLTTTGATVSYTQSWIATDAFGKASQLVLLNPGVTAPSPSASPSAAPVGGRAPLHIPNLAYYQGINVNTRISASWFGQHYTMTQQGSGVGYALAFLAAGGKYAMTYSDPTMVARCTWPAKYICPSALGTSTGLPNESSWLHDKYGRRLHVISGGTKPNGQWQERLNPGDPTVRAAYAAQTGAWGGNAIFADDTSASIDPTPPGTLDYDMYKYGAIPYEYCKGTTAQCEVPSQQFVADFGAMLSSSAHPVFMNGGTLSDNLAVMQANPNIIGNGVENCYTPTISDATWQVNQDFILRATALHKYSLCFPKHRSNQTAERAFYLASYWMVYDGTYAVLWEDFPMSNGDQGIMPEYGVVPGTATVNPTQMSNLRKATGVYVREFTGCAQNGVVFGRCAAIVNTTTATVSRPALGATYSQTMSFGSTTSWYDGGTAQWTSGAPTTIAPQSGVILR